LSIAARVDAEHHSRLNRAAPRRLGDLTYLLTVRDAPVSPSDVKHGTAFLVGRISGTRDEATGYQKVRPQNALQEYLKLIIREQLAAWVQKFPEEFFVNIYRLKGWVWPGMKKNRYSVVGHYINDLVYKRLGPGVLAELIRKSPKNEHGHRPNKLASMAHRGCRRSDARAASAFAYHDAACRN
jgi:hypothetical protein